MQEPKINTYVNFRDDVLPRIKRLGYNAVQIMAIQEHSYYASFGYMNFYFLCKGYMNLQHKLTAFFPGKPYFVFRILINCSMTLYIGHTCDICRYHVTNFFAPSSRFGTPDELKSLIDRAHELDLVVLMDIVHRY